MDQQVSTFVAQDGTGRAHTIQVVRVFKIVGSAQDPSPQSKSLYSLQTTEGERVARVQRGVYRLLPSGRVVQSEDPDAF